MPVRLIQTRLKLGRLLLSVGCGWVADTNVADMLQASSQHMRKRPQGPYHQLSLDPVWLQPVRCMRQFSHSNYRAFGHATAVAAV